MVYVLDGSPVPGFALATIMFNTASDEDGETLPARSEASQPPALSKTRTTGRPQRTGNPCEQPNLMSARTASPEINPSDRRTENRKLALMFGACEHRERDNRDHWVTRRASEEQKLSLSLFYWTLHTHAHTRMHMDTHAPVQTSKSTGKTSPSTYLSILLLAR